MSDSTKSKIPSAAEARAEAAKGFRTQVETVFENALRSGQTRVELNITEVSPEFTDALEAELIAGGYGVKRSNVSSGSQNYRLLKIAF